MNVDRRSILAVRAAAPAWCALALASAVLAGCDTVSDRPARWSYIHAAIIRPSCATASCHSYEASVGGLDLSTPGGAYSVLTGTVCGAPVQAGASPGSFVWPGDPERSRLLYLLRGTATYAMPPDVPLPPVEVNLIEQWILEGATCDTAQ
jgi:hypothetical protein